MYTDFKTSIITYSLHTPFIHIGYGVLQGDCLIPLLFNLCFNDFSSTLNPFSINDLVLPKVLNLNPIHWFQFADDAAVISGQESENQHLINRFIIWCQWSDMIIRVDKCITLGIKKLHTKSVQCLPKLFLSGVLVPCVTMGGSFHYLRRYFDFKVSNHHHMPELTSLVQV